MANNKTETKKLEETRYLCELYEKIKVCESKISAMYLATIMGMWSHVFGVGSKQNPFVGKGDSDLMVELARSWGSGWSASYNSLYFKAK